jgi:hypothetical protein
MSAAKACDFYSALLNIAGRSCHIASKFPCSNVRLAVTISPTIVWEFEFMPNVRRARAIAIAKAEDRSRVYRFRLLMLAAGATAAILALPAFFF